MEVGGSVGPRAFPPFWALQDLDEGMAVAFRALAAFFTACMDPNGPAWALTLPYAAKIFLRLRLCCQHLCK